MPTNEREALRAAVAAQKQAMTRRPLRLDLIDEIEAMQADKAKGADRA